MMGYTVTRYKCDLDGVCRVLRDGEMEWVQIDSAAQFKIDVAKMTENVITHYTGGEEYYSRFPMESVSEVAACVGDMATTVIDTLYTYKVLITSLAQLVGS